VISEAHVAFLAVPCEPDDSLLSNVIEAIPAVLSFLNVTFPARELKRPWFATPHSFFVRDDNVQRVLRQ
jgi:hypothetical protein